MDLIGSFASLSIDALVNVHLVGGTFASSFVSSRFPLLFVRGMQSKLVSILPCHCDGVLSDFVPASDWCAVAAARVVIRQLL